VVDLCNENEIIKKCQSGDRDAFDSLISLYYPHVIRFLSGLNVNQNIIEDITQDTFVKLIKNIEKYNVCGKAQFSTYLFTIARNCLINELRKNKQVHYDIDSLAEILSAKESTEEIIIRSMDYEELEKTIAALPPVQQTVIRLRYFEGLSLKEIGERTGVTDKTVKSRIHRAVTGLKQKIMKGASNYVL